MTPSEMEEAIKNCDLRLRAIEQILPTLATQADVREEILALRSEMRERLDALKTHVDTGLDDVREDVQSVASIVAPMSINVRTLVSGQQRLERLVQALVERDRY